MRVRVVKLIMYSPVLERYWYGLEAENGITGTDWAGVYIPRGTELQLPDEAWQPDSMEYTVQCDGCGYTYTGVSVKGGTLRCPACDTEEKL
jgi:hypothetical protein